MDAWTPVLRFSRQERLPVAYCEDERLEPFPELADRLRLVLLRQGTGVVELGGRSFPLTAPGLLCLHEREPAGLRAALNWRAESLRFHPAYINGELDFDRIRNGAGEPSATLRQDIHLFRPFVRREDGSTGCLDVPPLLLGRLERLFASVRDELAGQAHRAWSCRARAGFLELLFAVSRLHEEPGPAPLPGPPSDLAARVLLHLGTHYGEKVSVPELCRRFGTNRTTLQARFREATGQPVMAYLIALRVKLATLMLRDTSLPVEEIAGRLGFSDSTHLGKAMTRLTGLPPSGHRRAKAVRI